MYRRANRDLINKKGRMYRRANRDRINKRYRFHGYDAAYYARNRDRINKLAKRWRAEQKSKITEERLEEIYGALTNALKKTKTSKGKKK